MLISFEGKTVIVAGAARGIGRAITRAFAAEGARVLACDRLVGEIEAVEGVTALAVDVTDPASIDSVVAQAGGRVDVLAYVAGGVLGQRPKPLEEVTPEEFAGIVDVNLKGCFLFVRGVAPVMKNAGSGRIVTISSRAGLATSLTGIQAYASAKHGQVGLVKQLAQELGPFGITVNSVAPGFMATSPDYEWQWNSYSEEFRRTFADRIAMRRMGTPEDIADAVLFLASDRASWITGQTLPVTGSPLA
ncbi:MAG: SDR family NAD(P)-dependent oxidoreductase [Alphaproteobacteria bacterium]|nr:SDR family NAD(P)-dependent oxidoreductase [Alphaproteobacteria bacterium]